VSVETVAHAAPPWRSFVRRHEPRLLSIVGVVGFLCLWELAVRTGLIGETVASSPSAIWEAARELAASGRLWQDTRVTLVEFGLAFVLALVFGILAGVLAGVSRRGSYLINPWLEVLYATPLIALTPMFILWFGIGTTFKVVLGALVGLFPIAVNVRAGVQATEASLVTVANSFGASRAKAFWSVVVPGTVPYLFSGIHQAAGRVLVAVVIGELLASNEGLGFMIAFAGQTFNIPNLMVAIVVLAAIGTITVHLLVALEKRFARWRPVQRVERRTDP
jgi:ABC-type nitrate/sulfonate/bicarbonate transport system permease component